MQEYNEFQASVVHIARLCLKNKKQAKNLGVVQW